MEEGANYSEDQYGASSIRDLEERNRNLKDRLILIGQNLIDFRDKTEDEILEMKKDIETLNNNVEKIRDFIETLSGEVGKFAKKEDLDILVKQAKMFQPMEFVKKSDLETHHKK
ncbi:hypothetical protein GW932_02035 [archaeon]|nr:hypothetical protein [archaeon]